MLKLIQDLAKDSDLRDEFADDCEAVIARYNLSAYEMALFRSRNSASIETYLKNGIGADPIYAATTVVVSQVVSVAVTVATSLTTMVNVSTLYKDPDDQTGVLLHNAYWQRVATRAQALVHGG